MRLGAETEEEAEAIKGEVEDEVGELGAEVVVSPAPTSTTPLWGVSDAEDHIFVINVRKCLPIVTVKVVRQLGMWTRFA